MNSPDFNRYKRMVDEHLPDYLPEVDPKSSSLLKAMTYSLTAGGKRIRPILLLAACELCGGSAAAALPYACAVEYIQTYSLVHDDLPCMDDDDYRRGKPSNHRIFGEGMAVLAGDGLLSAAYEAMTKDMLLYLDDSERLKRRVKAAFEISKGTGCRGMIAGQVSDMEAEGRTPDPQLLAYIHLNKTAAFIKSVLLAGAHLGGADAAVLAKLSVFGENLGLAFQIVDDIMDVIGKGEERGKAAGGDAEAEKSTYPALYGIEKSKEYAMELLSKARAAIRGYYDHAEALSFVLDYLERQIN